MTVLQSVAMMNALSLHFILRSGELATCSEIELPTLPRRDLAVLCNARAGSVVPQHPRDFLLMVLNFHNSAERQMAAQMKRNQAEQKIDTIGNTSASSIAHQLAGGGRLWNKQAQQPS
eukprot:3690305-Amphidinium_carterae.1